MIIDTSALMAIVVGEAGWEALREALDDKSASIPASALTELQLVAEGRSRRDGQVAEALVVSLIAKGLQVAAFEHRHAEITAVARARFGKGNGRGGLLNFGDLMVYAIAKERGQPVLCTGRDFAGTDIVIHPASRLD